MALKQEGGGPWSKDSAVCGQTVRVVIPESESTQTTRTLRQLLLRFVHNELFAMYIDHCIQSM